MIRVNGLTVAYLVLTLIIIYVGISLIAHGSLINMQTNSLPPSLSGYSYTGSLSNNTNVIVTIYVPLRNLNLLYHYVELISSPGSPMYHHFLSKAQVASLFYPINEYNNVTAFLKEHGFRILFTAADSIIVAEGNVSAVERYLGLRYAVYSNGSVSFYESYGEPKLGNVMIYSSNITMLLLEHPSFLVTGSELNGLRNYVKSSVNLTYPIEAYWPTMLQGAYNATALYEMGYYGQNYTIGIIDFFGDPYIVNQLTQFDYETGLPNPPSFNIIPIGPYNPNLGVYNGWAYEISLDVEAAHAIAPEAGITLYVANPALPLAAIIAYIVDQDNVNVVSQSFGFPESILSTVNGPVFYFNVFLTDEYYALGSVEGITFTAASGDGGGAGYSNGPIGAVIYPSTSPYVTAVGGTTTYIQLPNGSYYQTAWSSYGFIPLDENLGGSTGGVSAVEPKPWYQWGITTPNSYPLGRMVPDVAMDASPYPGLLIVGPGNTLLITGGTSAAAPLLAGLLTLIMDYVHSSLGLINPALYSIANNTNEYGKAIVPITFGYNIPWTAHYGYNMVTGLGTINAGYFAEALSALSNQSKGGLSITVNVFNSSGYPQRQYYPGERIIISASIIANSTQLVTSGNFSAIIENPWGTIAIVPLRFTQPLGWAASITLPSNASGILMVTVYGKYSNLTGYGFTTVFSGYYAQFLEPLTFIPLYSKLGIWIEVNLTNAYGSLPINVTNLTALVYYYDYINNSYVLIGNVTLRPQITSQGFGLTPLFIGKLPSDAPMGNLLIRLTNAFGFVAFVNGIMMQSMSVLPPIVAQPGSVAAGGDVIVAGYPTPPLDLGQVSVGTGTYVFYNVLYGSNVTASLIGPNGEVISRANIYYNPSVGAYYGVLNVPQNAAPGLYLVALNASYDSYTLNSTITGSYFAEIYVSRGYSTPLIRFSSLYATEGQVITIYANITYPNGTEVKYGMYSAVVYPISLSGIYPALSQLFETPLWYNPKIGLWVGNVTLPSQFSLGSLTYLEGNMYFSSPYGVLITGVSADGFPTPSSLLTQSTFYVLPYTLVSDQLISNMKAYHLALINDTLVNGVYVDDVLINDTLIGNVTLINCNASNITILNSNATVMLSNINNINAVNSTIMLFTSKVNELSIASSRYINENSVVKHIYPPPPVVIINYPSGDANLTGLVAVNFTVMGDDVSNTVLYLNGHELASYSGNGTFTYALNTGSYPDGTYELTVVALQADGSSASATVVVNIENGLLTLNNRLNAVNQFINSSVARLSNELSSNMTLIYSEFNRLNSNLLIMDILLLVALALSSAALSWFIASRRH
ncbi:protease pro-enzyme activation domain-containing protein [Caldivirga maquilingensis]|uniref:Peptidase S53 propeptide n=1 Tax=Caldivirga maquilingensis (strain ATCC 700844 / DSM 13496 / JCM 10307 / IC-167) TaxID=397948 RepID=A8M9U1_CALMQ|nr:protease pro-enzyme activation domain-containing protein [Caldivirga maquilingensis]ABW02412.1 Peptidase S53 propeptide [Caldivirga maquilingensis IC-167]